MSDGHDQEFASDSQGVGAHYVFCIGKRHGIIDLFGALGSIDCRGEGRNPGGQN